MDKHITKMTAQEIFDHGAKHLLTQNERSLDIEKGCMYRGPNGSKCAVGIFITDEEYDPRMEGFSLDEVASNAFLDDWDFLFEVDEDNKLKCEVLENLQEIHDESFEEEWREQLQGMADYLKLDSKVLEDVYSES